MPNLEDLIDILADKKDDSNTKWTSGWKGVIMVVLILTITLFYESDRITDYIIDTKEKIMLEDNGDLSLGIEDFFLNNSLDQLRKIKHFKDKIGLSQFQLVEKEVIKKLRDDPIAFIKSSLEKEKQLDYISTHKPDNNSKMIKVVLEKDHKQLDNKKAHQNVTIFQENNEKFTHIKPLINQARSNSIENKDEIKTNPEKSQTKSIKKTNAIKNNHKKQRLTKTQMKQFQKEKLVYEQDLMIKTQIAPNSVRSNVEKLKPPYRVLMIGDSMMKGQVGLSIAYDIKNKANTRVFQRAVVSSGLAFPQYFDWLQKLNHYIKQYKPNVLVVMIGTNDFHSLYSREKRVRVDFDSPLWSLKYKNETLRLMKIISQNRLLTFWIGLPIMEKPKLNQRIIKVNSLHQECAQNFANIHYISTWTLFGKNLQHIQKYLLDKKGRKVRVRARDGIHLGVTAARLVSEITVDIMSQFMVLE